MKSKKEKNSFYVESNLTFVNIKLNISELSFWFAWVRVVWAWAWDLESSFMMLQNFVREWLECKPLPITLQSTSRGRVGMGMNMEISTQPSPKLGESRKEVYFTQPDLVGIGRASNVNIVIDIFFNLSGSKLLAWHAKHSPTRPHNSLVSFIRNTVDTPTE